MRSIEPGRETVLPEAPAPHTARRKSALGGPRRGVTLLAASLCGLVVLYAAALYVLQPAAPGHQVTLDVVTRAATDSRISSVELLDADARVTGTLRETTGRELRFWSAYPRSDATTNDLLGKLLGGGAIVSVNSQPTKQLVRFVAQFLMPLVILANLFALLFFLVRGGTTGADHFLEFGQIGDKRFAGQRMTTFSDVAGAGDAVNELLEVRDYLAERDAFALMGAVPPKGVLIIGPPGCGKTLMARAVAGEARANFFSISGSEFVESLVGVGAARVRDLFAQARASVPAVIFIDELDAVGRQRGTGMGGGHDEREQTLNELLVQMDGFSPIEGVTVLAATNRVDVLDPALLRRGRFDRHIVVERPDVESRLAILRLHALGKRLTDPHAHLPEIARHTAGFTGADLASLLNEAALLAVREKATGVGYAHLEEAVERIVSGPRLSGALISPADKSRTAYHEAGHAVVAAALGAVDLIDKLSIVARGRGIGHLTVLDERALTTKGDMERRIAIAMAGIAAEVLVFGEPSTGAEADLERATNTARDMAGRFGMSTRLGRARILREHREVFLGRDYLQSRDVSQPTLEHLDAEIRQLLDEQETVGRVVLEHERPILDALAGGLVAQETLQGAPLRRALGFVKPASRHFDSVRAR